MIFRIKYLLNQGFVNLVSLFCMEAYSQSLYNDFFIFLIFG